MDKLKCVHTHIKDCIEYAKNSIITDEYNLLPFDNVPDYAERIIEDVVMISKACEICGENEILFEYLDEPLILKRGSEPIVIGGIQIIENKSKIKTTVLIQANYENYFQLNRIKNISVFIIDSNNKLSKDNIEVVYSTT